MNKEMRMSDPDAKISYIVGEPFDASMPTDVSIRSSQYMDRSYGVEFQVAHKDGDNLGRLKVLAQGISWRPQNAHNSRSVGWKEFARWIEETGMKS